MSNRSKLNEIKKTFDTYLIDTIVSNCNNEDLKEAIIYFLSDGGKRLRPCLAIASYSMYYGNYDKVLPFACAIELIHNYSLVHDDLPAMDNDDYRRGKETVHKKFGEAIAILAGDALLSMAYEVMLSNISALDSLEEISSAIKATYLIADKSGINGMIKGQVLDIKDSASSIKDIEIMYELKTSNLFNAAILSGAILAKAPLEEIKLLGDFSFLFGRMFQLIDDIDDYDKDLKQEKLSFATEYGKAESTLIAKELYDKAVLILEKLEKTFYRNTSVLKEIIEQFNFLADY